MPEASGPEVKKSHNEKYPFPPIFGDRAENVFHLNRSDEFCEQIPAKASN